MRKFILVVVLTLMTQHRAFSTESCSIYGTVVFYTNGIDTDPDITKKSYEKLQLIVQQTIIQGEPLEPLIDKHKVEYDFRHISRFSDNADSALNHYMDRLRIIMFTVKDFARSNFGLTLSDWDFIKLIYGTGSLTWGVLTSATLVDLTLSLLKEFWTGQIEQNLEQMNQSNVSQLVSAYRSYLNGKRRVLAVTHGEGNLFNNEAYELTYDISYNPLDSVNESLRSYFSSAHIAPVSGMSSQGVHRSYNHDHYLYDDLILSRSAPSPNIVTIIENQDDRTGHKFIDTYLDFILVSEGTMEGILEASSLLKSNCPKADFIPRPQSSDPLTIEFDGSTTTNPSNVSLEYSWDYADNSKGDGVITQHKYSSSGKYQVSLTVKTPSGYEDTISQEVNVGEGDEPLPPPPKEPPPPPPPYPGETGGTGGGGTPPIPGPGPGEDTRPKKCSGSGVYLGPIGSPSGNVFVASGAYVDPNAIVTGNVEICGSARVMGSAQISATPGSVKLDGSAVVSDGMISLGSGKILIDGSAQITSGGSINANNGNPEEEIVTISDSAIISGPISADGSTASVQISSSTKLTGRLAVQSGKITIQSGEVTGSIQASSRGDGEAIVSVDQSSPKIQGQVMVSSNGAGKAEVSINEGSDVLANASLIASAQDQGDAIIMLHSNSDIAGRLQASSSSTGESGATVILVQDSRETNSNISVDSSGTGHARVTLMNMLRTTDAVIATSSDEAQSEIEASDAVLNLLTNLSARKKKQASIKIENGTLSGVSSVSGVNATMSLKSCTIGSLLTASAEDGSASVTFTTVTLNPGSTTHVRSQGSLSASISASGITSSGTLQSWASTANASLTVTENICAAGEMSNIDGATGSNLKEACGTGN